MKNVLGIPINFEGSL